MNNVESKLQILLSDYESGLYTKEETVGALLEILKNVSVFLDFWENIPEWAQYLIWNFLKKCDETSILYNFSSQTRGVIDPNLIALKRWLTQEKGYA